MMELNELNAENKNQMNNLIPYIISEQDGMVFLNSLPVSNIMNNSNDYFIEYSLNYPMWV